MKPKTTLDLVLFVTTIWFISSCTLSKESKNEIPEIEADTSWALIPFEKVDSLNPILAAGDNVFTCPVLRKKIKWEEKDVFNPAAVIRDGKVYLLYRAEDKIGKFAGTSRIGLAVSNDGLHFVKMPEPVLAPANDSLKIFEWEGGIEDPRVVESEDGRYILTYTAYDGVLARLMLATSTNLQQWTKYGRVLKGKFADLWSKSGAIVAKQVGSRIVAQKVNGKYWMYFGDTDIFLATSDDLINWQPVEDNNGKLKPILSPREGFFDSRLVESGPYALVRPQGILLIYNGMNLDSAGMDPKLPAGAYSVGQALFKIDDPTVLEARLANYFMKPDKPYELEGQVNLVCFAEGLVPFNDRWYLYYGTADSKIAVAVCAP